jgi:hypothetical protein
VKFFASGNSSDFGFCHDLGSHVSVAVADQVKILRDHRGGNQA